MNCLLNYIRNHTVESNYEISTQQKSKPTRFPFKINFSSITKLALLALAFSSPLFCQAAQVSSSINLPICLPEYGTPFYADNRCSFNKPIQNLTSRDVELLAFEDEVHDVLNNPNSKLEYNYDYDVIYSGTRFKGLPILKDLETNKSIAAFKATVPHQIGTNMYDINRDLIAYLLDHGSLAQVPPAIPITLSDRSLWGQQDGVLVKWMNRPCATYGDLLASTRENRQAISVLDMRLGNQLREYNCNLLVDKTSGQLYPANHDSIFRGYLKGFYGYSSYSDHIFSVTQRIKDYIERLDINEDASLLRSLNVPEGYIKKVVVRTVLLKLAAEEHCFAFRDIEQFIERADIDERIACCNSDYRSCFDILEGFKEPYNETELKDAFRDNFNRLKKWVNIYCHAISSIGSLFRRLFS